MSGPARPPARVHLNRRWPSAPARPAKDPSRRIALSAGGSVILHAVFVVLLVAMELRDLTRDQPAPREIPLYIVDQPPFQTPPPLEETPIPQLRAPPPVRPTPAPPAAPDDRPLFGWQSQGETPGTPLRPPGPPGETLSPEAPGPRGEGMKDAERGAPEEGPGPPPSAPPATPVGPEDSGESPEPLGDWPVAPRRREGQGTPALPEPLPPGPDRRGSGEPGRWGEPGAGADYNVGLGGGFFGDLQFESGDFDWSDYSTKVYFAVYRAWLRELYGRVARFGRDQALLNLPNLDGQVVIQFVLLRDGSVSELEVVRPSPMPSLDEASSAALRRAVLPHLPDDFPRDRERVAFLFRLSGFESSNQLQRRLEYSQMRGEF